MLIVVSTFCELDEQLRFQLHDFRPLSQRIDAVAEFTDDLVLLLRLETGKVV
ncbi:hypothetical protein D3C87_1833740 [compost metagenome]